MEGCEGPELSSVAGAGPGSTATAAAAIDALLDAALDDGALYSALVPWITSQQGACSLGGWAAQRPQLQSHARGSADVAEAHPPLFRARTLALTHRHCLDEAKWGACARRPAAGSGDGGGVAAAPCDLPPRAGRLAKLHGHLLAHGLLPSPLEEVGLLVDMLAQAPLPAAAAPVRGGAATSAGGGVSKRKQQAASKAGAAAAEKPAGSEGGGAQAPGAGAGVLLPCSCAVARYAAKALECCGRLLAGLQPCLIQQLSNSAQLAVFAPHLVQSLERSAAAPALSDVAATSTNNQHGQQMGSAASQGGNRTPTKPPQPNRPNQQTPHQTPAAIYSPAKHAAPGAMPSGAGSGARRKLIIGAATPQQPSQASAAIAGASAASSSAAPLSAGGGGGAASGGGAVVRPAVSTVGLLKPSGARPGRGAELAGAAPAVDGALVANRERGRDSFFAALRDVTTRLAAARHQQQQQQLAGAAGAGADGGSAGAVASAPAAQPSGPELEELLLAASDAMQRLLAALAPESLAHLAELVTACVLQAAATGEALVEPRLVVLAEKDLGKFHKLQQRLNRGGAEGGGGGVAAAAKRAPAVAGPSGFASGRGAGAASLLGAATVAGGHHSGGGAAAATKGGFGSQPRAPAARGGGHDAAAAPHHAPRHQGGGRGAGPGLALAFARAAAVAQLLRDFPAAQHPFVCLIEAADSARLNGALLRVMAARAAQLMQPLAGRPLSHDALGHQCRSAVALARYIGHLAYAGGGAAAADAAADAAGAPGQLAPLPPLALLPLLEQARGSAWGLALAVPFACNALARLPRAAAAVAASPPVREPLLWLRQLQAAPGLRPQGAGFGQLAMCIGASLEGLFRDLEAAGVQVPTPEEAAAAAEEEAAAAAASAAVGAEYGEDTPATAGSAAARARSGMQQQQQQQQERAEEAPSQFQNSQTVQFNQQLTFSPKLSQFQQQQQQRQERAGSPGRSQGATPIPFLFQQHKRQQQQQSGDQSSTKTDRECTSQPISRWDDNSPASQQQARKQQQQQQVRGRSALNGSVCSTPAGQQTPLRPAAAAPGSAATMGSVGSSNTAASVCKPPAGTAAAAAATPPPSACKAADGAFSTASSRHRAPFEAAAGGVAAGAMGEAAWFQGGLSEVLAGGAGLVDALYWSLACPGRSRLARRLQEMQRQQLPPVEPAQRSGKAASGGAPPADGRRAGGAQPQAPRQQQSEAGAAGASAAASNASSPGSTASAGSLAAASGTAAAARRRLMAVPTLAAPRAPPQPAQVPASLQDALQQPADPIRQQLRVALLQQYSPDEQPVGSCKLNSCLASCNRAPLAYLSSFATQRPTPHNHHHPTPTKPSSGQDGRRGRLHHRRPLPDGAPDRPAGGGALRPAAPPAADGGRGAAAAAARARRRARPARHPQRPGEGAGCQTRQDSVACARTRKAQRDHPPPTTHQNNLPPPARRPSRRSPKPSTRSARPTARRPPTPPSTRPWPRPPATWPRRRPPPSAPSSPPTSPRPPRRLPRRSRSRGAWPTARRGCCSRCRRWCMPSWRSRQTSWSASSGASWRCTRASRRRRPRPRPPSLAAARGRR